MLNVDGCDLANDLVAIFDDEVEADDIRRTDSRCSVNVDAKMNELLEASPLRSIGNSLLAAQT